MKFPSIVSRLLRGMKSMKKHLARSFRAKKLPKYEDDLVVRIDREDFIGNSDAEKKPKRIHLRLLKKKNLVRAMRKTRLYERFGKDKKTKPNSAKRVRFAPSTKSAAPSRHRRLRAFRKYARKSLENLALGTSGAAAGYGMPPGFNPNAFRPVRASREYPEVFTCQQLQWLAQNRKTTYAISHTQLAY